VDATFKGSYIDYLVDIGDWRLKVHDSIREGSRTLKKGDMVFLSWSPEDALVLAG
jgi:hypothetical protein